MKSLIIAINCIAVVLLCGWSNTERSNKLLGDFKLRNIDGKYISPADYPDSKGMVLLFLCNHCPMAKKYFGKINDLNTDCLLKGYPVLAINPMDSLVYEEESWAGMVQVAKAKKLNYPYLQDANQTLAKSLGVTHTPEAFVFTKTDKGLELAYEGAIDNGEVGILQSWISQAINELNAQKPVTVKKQVSIGCAVYYRKK